MNTMQNCGQIVILNGMPRSGKTTIASAIQTRFPGLWISLCAGAPRSEPTVGRGAEDAGTAGLPPLSPAHAALYEATALYSRMGLNVVADFGLNGRATRAPGLLAHCAGRLSAYPVLLVGLRNLSSDLTRSRRRDGTAAQALFRRADDATPLLPGAWRRPGLYDMELDTDVLTPTECADAILERLDRGIPRPTALERVAGRA
ncbi:chloramphenicol phosphotransferase [Rhizobium sp. CG5]|uniref:phosphotransferase-like protein n=1 Tax=Rhizobium sp. CG5 TaxID=2726076 RepID=UPI00203454DA|nr:chloramphenicol phosphotransferase [Rhizobium sp. CG5]MCM2476935.1 chloramphenicol phosphotransferase [Rhizobium sp. CG5]